MTLRKPIGAGHTVQDGTIAECNVIICPGPSDVYSLVREWAYAHSYYSGICDVLQKLSKIKCEKGKIILAEKMREIASYMLNRIQQIQ